VGVQAQTPLREATSATAIPYTGRLTDESGQPVGDGAYDFTFTLYDAATGGEALWSEVQQGVSVQGGAFVTTLGRAEPLPDEVLAGGERWLEIAVRGPGEADFSALAPRQRLSTVAPAAPAGPASGSACPHDHWGENWSGSGTGLTLSGGAFGVNATGSTIGLYGQSDSTTGIGVSGFASAASGTTYGMYGYSHSTAGTGVYGYADNATGTTTGVYGKTESPSGRGVVGVASATSGSTIGVYGRTYSSGGMAVYGKSDSLSGYAGYFHGKVYVTGYLQKAGGGFKIDHPLDPANKYLIHSFVESPDMKNVYDGVVTLDENGTAWVDLPDWFQALNQDFRYQLTPIGAPGPNLYIAQEIQDNRFQIAGGEPGMKVSWQVTGIRHDAYAEAHRIPVEEEKPPEERGTYLHPVELGQPKELGLDYQRNAERGR
jgi:hypothetical protein